MDCRVRLRYACPPRNDMTAHALPSRPDELTFVQVRVGARGRLLRHFVPRNDEYYKGNPPTLNLPAMQAESQGSFLACSLCSARRSIRRGEGTCPNNRNTAQSLILDKGLFAYLLIGLFTLYSTNSDNARYKIRQICPLILPDGIFEKIPREIVCCEWTKALRRCFLRIAKDVLCMPLNGFCTHNNYSPRQAVCYRRKTLCF